MTRTPTRRRQLRKGNDVCHVCARHVEQSLDRVQLDRPPRVLGTISDADAAVLGGLVGRVASFGRRILVMCGRAAITTSPDGRMIRDTTITYVGLTPAVVPLSRPRTRG
jgi:hypothetical protein